jgi:alkylation response protein AidB-like acyl-CoA dehydrogenase
MRTRAEKVDRGWKINGTKTFISNGPVADVAIIFAVTDPGKGFHGGVSGFLVDAGQPGLSTGKPFEKMGLRTSPIGELVFQDMFVPDDAVLGKVGAGSAVFGTAMDWERALLVAGHVGVMERLLETAVGYARTRNQFNQSIGKFQAVLAQDRRYEGPARSCAPARLSGGLETRQFA